MGEKKLDKSSIEDLLKKEVWTYEEYIQIFPPWSKKTLERRIQDDGFPFYKDGTITYIPAAKARLWWKKREGQN